MNRLLSQMTTSIPMRHKMSRYLTTQTKIRTGNRTSLNQTCMWLSNLEIKTWRYPKVKLKTSPSTSNLRMGDPLTWVKTSLNWEMTIPYRSKECKSQSGIKVSLRKQQELLIQASTQLHMSREPNKSLKLESSKTISIQILQQLLSIQLTKTKMNLKTT